MPSARRTADRAWIGCAVAALHGVARRTAVPATPSASNGASIRRTTAALHRITRWAAVPSLPAIAVTVWRRRRIIILSIRRPFRDCGSRAACREKFAAAYLSCHVLLPSSASAPRPPGHLHLFFQYASELIGR